MNTFLILLFCLFTVSQALILQKSQEYLELTPPLPTDRFTPSCSLPIINHISTNTTNATSPVISIPYSPPPNCPAPWAYVVLQLHGECSNDSSHRISALWLGGSELLRTSTPKMATDALKNFWKVKKDITRYSSLLTQTNLDLTLMLQNVVNTVSTAAVYNISVTLFFYNNKSLAAPSTSGSLDLRTLDEYEAISDGDDVLEQTQGLYQTPADLIIPISDDGDNGFWFRIRNELDLHSKQILVPRNTYRAVLELYVSFHGSDEAWFSNPPSSYLRMNNITSFQGNGAYREIFVTIDGSCVGSDFPFPVLFSNEINPLLWKPVVATGAFNLPSYDFDVTPFLEKVLDGKVHEFGVGVGSGIPYWLVDANLHLWLDKDGSSAVIAGIVVAQNPSLTLQSKKEFKRLDGSFEIKGKGKSESKGWVISNAGNLTTVTYQQFKFQSHIRFDKNGTHRAVQLRIKVHKEVKVVNDAGKLINRIVIKRKYPLNIITSTVSDRIISNVSHAFEEKFVSGSSMRYVYNNQESNGWMQTRANQSSIVGDGGSEQRLHYKDEFSCYSRTIAVSSGILTRDDLSYGCLNLNAYLEYE